MKDARQDIYDAAMSSIEFLDYSARTDRFDIVRHFLDTRLDLFERYARQLSFTYLPDDIIIDYCKKSNKNLSTVLFNCVRRDTTEGNNKAALVISTNNDVNPVRSILYLLHGARKKFGRLWWDHKAHDLVMNMIDAKKGDFRMVANFILRNLIKDGSEFNPILVKSVVKLNDKKFAKIVSSDMSKFLNTMRIGGSLSDIRKCLNDYLVVSAVHNE